MHIPERMCIACRQMKSKSELYKIVKYNSTIEIDFEHNKFGRGAYICKSEKCIMDAQKRKSISRHFKMQVDEKIYQEILEKNKNE